VFVVRGGADWRGADWRGADWSAVGSMIEECWL
jgi:hypothetical protein